MSDFAIVSIDMFQTLVELASRRHHIWRQFLQERYSEQLAEECWALSSKSIMDHYHRLTSQSNPFVSLRSIFKAGLAELFPTIGLDLDPNEAVRILVAEHRSASPYEDTKAFLASVGERYPICLVTDTDDDMLSPSLLGLHEFDSIFTSEQLRSYKNNPQCKLFSAVVKHYGIAPAKILHIGDSSADVLGAHRVGMKTCWLNRSGNSWHHDIEPDYTVRTLLEAASILGVSPRYRCPR